jgi:Phage head-tail joining protein
MRQHIKIVKYDTVGDGFGGLVATEVTLLSTTANVRYLSSGRSAEANQAQINQTIEVKLWKRAAYIPEVGQIVFWQGRGFSIKSITETLECPILQTLTATIQT